MVPQRSVHGLTLGAGRFFPALLAAPLLLACRSESSLSPAEIESTLQARAHTVVRDPAFVLWSPYEAEATSPYADVLREQSALVRRLFADTLEEPLRMYLVPVPMDASQTVEVWTPVGEDGVAGGAFDEGFGFIYVTESSGERASFLRSRMHEPDLRHEIAHLYARRCGLMRARWFEEGMACDVEAMGAQDHDLLPHPFPPALITARDTARSGSVAELLRWARGEMPDAHTAKQNYAQSQALFRFLCEREPSGSWLERSRAVWTLDDAHVLALEPDWLAWLARIDVLAEIRRGTGSDSVTQRIQAAALLPVLAEHGQKDVLTRAADELAMELVADRDASEPAVTFLLFFRAKQLTSADVANLAASTEPGPVLTAEALHARRNEPVDLGRARAAWSRLSVADQGRFTVAAALIPGLDKQ